MRNGHPYSYIDLERDPDVQNLLDSFQISANEIPVLIGGGQHALRNPNNQQIADCLRFNESIDQTQVCDLVVIGAGPSGLAAGQCMALVKDLMFWFWKRVRLVARQVRAQESKITWGFPQASPVRELAVRAYNQAQKFGAAMLINKGTRLVCDHKPYEVVVEKGPPVSTRTIVIATGAEYRKPQCNNLSHFEGAGIYYSATYIEAQLCSGEEVIVVGGGNAAGQATIFLAQSTKRVHMLVRSNGLEENMSRYLIRRIEDTPSIVVHSHTEIAKLEGGDHFESVRWQNNQTKQYEEHKIRHVFLMIGADSQYSLAG